MLGREEELEAFKTRINLTEYAAARGFRPVRKKTYRNSVVMDDGNGTKIVIARDIDGHYIYFDPLNQRDSGSIVDFELNRNGRDFGQMRKTLRGWLPGGSSFAPPRPAPETYVPELKPVRKDLLQVRVRLEAMTPVTRNHYLENVRCIPADVLAHPRFAGRILSDARGNIIFPHHDQEGPCGYEIKNDGYTTFASGGEKALWHSNFFPDDNTLVIVETGMNAPSHFDVFSRPDHTRYFSTAGALNAKQLALILLAMQHMLPGSRALCATDNDDGGRRIYSQIAAACAQIDNPRCELVKGWPDTEGDDWNDVQQRVVRMKANPVAGLSP